MINLPFDISIDYFSVLGVHYGASTDQVKKAYRKMARRYHPDVSKIHDAKEKFQEISEAYEILRKYREDYCHQYSRKLDQKREQARYQQSRTSQAKSKKSGYSTGQSQQGYGFHSDFRGDSDSSRHSNHSKHSGNSEADKQQEFQWEFQSRNNGVHRPIHGKDRVIEYPLTLRYAIRQLRIGRFYVPGLKVSMKFTRQAFEGKTFRIAGKGYRGLFGGRDGDFLVRFQIRLDEERFELKGGDLYAKYFVAPSLMKPGQTIMLDTPSGRVDLVLPDDFSKREYFKISKMGLPEDEHNRPGDLFVKILPRELDKTKNKHKTTSNTCSKKSKACKTKNAKNAKRPN